MLISKKRVLRRDTRKVSSPYRVHCNNITENDELLLSIYDELDKSTPIFTYRFSGRRINSYNSIHFNASETDGHWQIDFIELNPD